MYFSEVKINSWKIEITFNFNRFISRDDFIETILQLKISQT